MNVRDLIFAGALLVFAGIPAGARAGSELDLTGSFSSFTSPNGVGPWTNFTLTDRSRVGNDTPGIALVDQTNADQAGPAHSLGFVLDDYHDWSPRFFTYAAFGLASGNALATRTAYVEGDGKFGRDLPYVFGLGGGIVVNPDGVVQRYLNLGPTWYHGNMNVTLRWLPSWTSGHTGTSTALLTLANGATGTTITTLTLLAGSQPPSGIVTAAQVVAVGQRDLLGGIDVKHWVNPEIGYHAGVDYEHLTDRMTGNLIYIRRALNVGIFWEIGGGLP